MPDYKIYATLLDSHAWYRSSESDNCEQELIDKINRVPVTDEDALKRMNKGTALNNVVDNVLSLPFLAKAPCQLIGEAGGMEFSFEPEIINGLVDYLQGSVSQYFTSFQMDVNGKSVELYGYIDYVQGYKAIDLKSTSKYELGKYKDSLQRHVYPVCLFNEGVNVEEFEFLVTDFKEVFKESYRVDVDESLHILHEQCAMLIDFLEAKRHLITDCKIFGGENVSREEAA